MKKHARSCTRSHMGTKAEAASWKKHMVWKKHIGLLGKTWFQARWKHVHSGVKTVNWPQRSLTTGHTSARVCTKQVFIVPTPPDPFPSRSEEKKLWTLHAAKKGRAGERRERGRWRGARAAVEAQGRQPCLQPSKPTLRPKPTARPPRRRLTKGNTTPTPKTY